MQTLIKDKNGDLTTTKIQLWVLFILAVLLIPVTIVANWLYAIEIQSSLFTYVGGLCGSGMLSYGYKKYLNYREVNNDTEN